MKQIIFGLWLTVVASAALALSPLCEEVTTDPLARGYVGMSAEEVVADLETEYRTRNRNSMSGQEVWELTVYSDFSAMTETQQIQWLTLTSNDALNPFGNSVELAKSLFGAGSATITSLANARIASISRAEELGLGSVRPGHVDQCRN